jgi:hypothetical protein
VETWKDILNGGNLESQLRKHHRRDAEYAEKTQDKNATEARRHGEKKTEKPENLKKLLLDWRE